MKNKNRNVTFDIRCDVYKQENNKLIKQIKRKKERNKNRTENHAVKLQSTNDLPDQTLRNVFLL